MTNLLENLKKTAEQFAYKTPIYDWRLHEKTPDRLVVRPIDPWPGNAQKAIDLLNAAGVGERTGAIWHNSWWKPEGADQIWNDHMHSFSWLRDLRTLSSPLAKEQGRVMIESWISCHETWDKESWRSDLIGRRLAMWISHYDYFCAGQGNDFEDRFLCSLSKQAKHLSHVIGNQDSVELLETLKGLLYAGMAIEGQDKWINQAVKSLEKTLSHQILPDGGHLSRSPVIMLDILEILVDIRTAFKTGAYTTPTFIKDTIESLSAALRTLRHRDRKLAIFHGSQEENMDRIDSILAQAGTRRKVPSRLKDTGYERLEAGQALLIMDVGAAPPYPHDKTAHASALAFEFSYGKERLFTNCGTHPLSKDWQEALRFTAAHNTACLDHRNSCEIKRDQHFGRIVSSCMVQREETAETILLNAAHNGYVPLNNITHTRTLRLGTTGNILRGEDSFKCVAETIGAPVQAALRFHIHPSAIASETQDSREILLRLPGGVGWRFSADNYDVKLDESLYIGSGIDIRKTKQIVINATISELNLGVKWALKRED